jgi:DNA-binding HxlR family transcriptional regulator
VRELVPGRAGLPICSRVCPEPAGNLLTERLRDLERDGIVARTEVPAPAARLGYELTAEGATSPTRSFR